MFRIGVLVSGNGSNLQAIIDAVGRGELLVEIGLVVCNRPKALAVDRAARHGLPLAVLPAKRFASREAQELAICEALDQADLGLVVMAGYDRIVGQALLTRFAGRLINIHPGLLPAFAGTLHAQREAFDYGVKVAGCTVHFVTEEVDGGPILVQRAVAVAEDDTAESLSARILELEHVALPKAIGLVAAGRVRIEGRRARILEGEGASAGTALDGRQPAEAG